MAWAPGTDLLNKQHGYMCISGPQLDTFILLYKHTLHSLSHQNHVYSTLHFRQGAVKLANSFLLQSWVKAMLFINFTRQFCQEDEGIIVTSLYNSHLLNVKC